MERRKRRRRAPARGGGGGGGGGEAGGRDDEWERGSVVGDGGADAQEDLKEADDALDREWYDTEEGGCTVDETHTPFLGDEKLFEKREEAMRKRVNHRAQARRRDAVLRNSAHFCALLRTSAQFSDAAPARRRAAATPTAGRRAGSAPPASCA